MDHDDVLSLALAEDSQVNNLGQAGLAKLSQLALQLVNEQEALASLEERVSAKKQDILKLEQGEIPTLMKEMHLTQLRLDDGSQLNVKDDVQVAIPVDKRPEAYEWMENNGHDGVIKITVSTDFGKGEYEDAVEFAAKVKAMTNREINVEKSVHPMTLKAWYKEVKNDDDIEEKPPLVPEGFFSVFEYSKAVVKSPKKKR